MSFWARTGLKIQDLEMFKQMCRKHGIDYFANEDKSVKFQGSTLVATLQDREGRSKAYLIESEGAIKFTVDNDPRYSSITKRLGKNGGKLCRDYAHGVAERAVMDANGVVNSVEETSDGGLLLRVAVM
jgi:hypothetical protein